LTELQKDYLANNFPSPPGTYPRKLSMCDNGKISQEDLYQLYKIKDKCASKRPAPACICCVKEISGNIGLTLCCVNLVCIKCIIEFAEKEFKGCPYCDANWALFQVQEVLVEAPEKGGYGLEKKHADQYREQWRNLLEKYKLLE